jgi:iron(III) transport system substrate-binding protein
LYFQHSYQDFFNMFRFHLIIFLIGSAIFFAETAQTQELVLYSGRSKSLVEPLIREFETQTGIRVRVRYGDTSQLAVALLEEGRRSPADVFWAQDGGALGVLSGRDMFSRLPQRILDKTSDVFRSAEGTWVATSGRARVVAYAPGRVDETELPQTIFDLADPKWRGRVGWAPQNASFQTFVSAMIDMHGKERTRTWLTAMRANNARSYRSNVPLVQALAAGEIDVCLTNHYYLLRFRETDPSFPVEQTFLAPGDIANFVNVAGAGVLSTARNNDEALTFIEFLLSAGGQRYIAGEVYEYPVVDGIEHNPALIPLQNLLELVPRVNVDRLDTLDETLQLFREVGLL